MHAGQGVGGKLKVATGLQLATGADQRIAALSLGLPKAGLSSILRIGIGLAAGAAKVDR